MALKLEASVVRKLREKNTKMQQYSCHFSMLSPLISLRLLTEISKHVLSLRWQPFMQVIVAEKSEFQSDRLDHISLGENLLPYKVWDTASQWSYKPIVPKYTYNAHFYFLDKGESLNAACEN